MVADHKPPGDHEKPGREVGPNELRAASRSLVAKGSDTQNLKTDKDVSVKNGCEGKSPLGVDSSPIPGSDVPLPS